MITIATLYPEALGTYGDGGNTLALSHRARARGYQVNSVDVSLGDALPTADIYLVGGGEDGPQRQAAEALRRDGSLAARLADGAIVLGVCAGLQILGESFEVAGGLVAPGLGLFDGETRRGEKRRVGNCVVDVDGRLLVGFENHGGDTTLGDAPALGRVRRGYGNDGESDGVRLGGLVGTYLHGPVLALNPWLCDQLLENALGETLDPYLSVADELYASRCRLLS
jgi:CobQ-like glutamine amidotransferase family enzyme